MLNYIKPKHPFIANEVPSVTEMHDSMRLGDNVPALRGITFYGFQASEGDGGKSYCGSHGFLNVEPIGIFKISRRGKPSGEIYFLGKCQSASTGTGPTWSDDLRSYYVFGIINPDDDSGSLRFSKTMFGFDKLAKLVPSRE